MFELAIEIIFKGTGYLVIRLVRSKTVADTLDDFICFLVGIVFWALAIGISILGYRMIIS